MGIEYLIITPVKDEEKYIEKTIGSIISQTLRPVRWIIVDDGSTDKTPVIVKNYCERYEWIDLIETKKNAPRNTGKAEVTAFNSGYNAVGSLNYNYIVKLDGDLSLPEYYFEKIFDEFTKGEKLGIASGIYLENYGRCWEPVEMPFYHAAGASKVIRRECFDEIGGFMAKPGWDTVDEIKAQYLGWDTCHFKDIKFYHLKNEGSGMGLLKTNIMHGEIFYLTGGRLRFFLLKFIKRMVKGRPPVLAGLMMLYGYLSQMVRRGRVLVNEGEARCYNELLAARVSETFDSRGWRKRWS